LREKLKHNRDSAVLFDLPRLARNIEAAYAHMWQVWRAGDKPAAFSPQG
jgi:predicted O-linked N-acetylglucosamine transferase (SPINDLY family)